MMFLVVSNVVMRFIFNDPITGTFELTQLAMALLVFAVAYTAVRGQHVSVDLVMSRFSKRVRASFDVVTLLMGMALVAVIAWRGFLEATQVNKQTSLLQLPFTPFYWIFAMGIAIFCLSIVVLIIESITEAGKK